MFGRGVDVGCALAILALVLVLGAGGAEGARQTSFPCEVCLVEVDLVGHGERILRRNPPSISDISPDGSTLLYTKAGVGVFTSRLDGSGERRLVADADVVGASFSPNGRQVAYVRADASATSEACSGLAIRLVDTDGTGDHLFQPCASRPLWSPDSQSLLFASATPAELGQWWIARLDGGGRHPVGRWEARSGYEPRSPRWSPRGDTLVYETFARPTPPKGHGVFTGGPMRGPATEIDIVRADGTRIAVIPRAAAPSWSPDGRRLAFTRVVPLVSYFGDSAYSLWIAGPSGQDAHRVRRGYDLAVDWSPNGRLLVSAAEGDVYLLRPDGSGLRRVTNDPSGGQITGLWWIRDGSHLRFLWECTQEFQPCGA